MSGPDCAAIEDCSTVNIFAKNGRYREIKNTFQIASTATLPSSLTLNRGCRCHLNELLAYTT